MLPIVDTPTIQYVVEEAVEAGITDILMIIGKGKRAIEEYFDRSFELEQQLIESQKFDDLKKIQKLTHLADIHFVWQKELKGLGDAIRYAYHHVNGEPFAVLLGDTLIECEQEPITRQLVRVYERYQRCVVALEEVDMEVVGRYGVIGGQEIQKNVYKVNEFVEKPEMNKTPSNLAIASRYIFTPEIFHYLDKVQPGLNNEVQLTDAMQLMLQDHDMYGLRFDGKRYDIGSKIDFLKTNVIYGLKKEELGEEFRQWLIDLVKNL